MLEEAEDKLAARSGIQVIARAATILRVLRDDPGGLSLGQIADRVDLARSTVQRIVAALQDERLVMSLGNGGIRLGPEVSSLAAAAHLDVARMCRPLLEQLGRRTGETADLSVLRGGKMLFVDQVVGVHRLRAVSHVGDEFPLTSTANGKAVLALLSDPEVERAMDREALSSRAKDRLIAQLDDIRAIGLAFDRDEHTDGISAAGIAFHDLNGEIHAISVPVPSNRFERERKNIEAALTDTRRHIQELLLG